MNPIEFGKELIRTNDLDPVYVLLWGSNWDQELLKRWLLSYWCFYHLGTACWINEVDDEKVYWDRMRQAAESKEYPRSSERRHFRGLNAKKSIDYLLQRKVSGCFRDIESCSDLSADSVMKAVQKWTGFGPWIAFKVADMIERCGLLSVEFDTSRVLLFDSPHEGARMWWESLGRTEPPKSVGDWAIDQLIENLSDYPAPPKYDRAIGPQEAETILCKWKSYKKGHYHLTEDIQACKKSLQFRPNDLTESLLKAGKIGGLW